MTENIDKDYLCGDFGEVTEWLQIKVTVKTEELDDLVAIMSAIESNLLIDDLSDIDLKTCYGDLIDESILNADKTIASVSVFLSAERPFTDVMSFVKGRLGALGIEGKFEIIGVNEEDYETALTAIFRKFVK